MDRWSTDHATLLIKLHVASTGAGIKLTMLKPVKAVKRDISEFTIEESVWTKYRDPLDKALGKILEEYLTGKAPAPPDGRMGIDEINEHITNAIVSVTECVCPEHWPIKEVKPWKDNQLHQLAKEAQKAPAGSKELKKLKRLLVKRRRRP